MKNLTKTIFAFFVALAFTGNAQTKAPTKPVAKAPVKTVPKAPTKPVAKTPVKPVSKAPIQAIAEVDYNLPTIDKLDNSFLLFPSKFSQTPLIYGYKLPDINSEKMICFSENENNRDKYVLGEYYETTDLNIKYISTEGNFVKLIFKEEGKQDEIFYIEKKYVNFN